MNMKEMQLNQIGDLMIQAVADSMKFACLKQLYIPEDYEKGEITSRNRNDLPEKFPLATLSDAMITNEHFHSADVDDFSKKIAKIKKQSKEIKGDSIVEYQCS